MEAGAHVSTAETTYRSPYNPIDHIFQFHKALKRDLTALEESAQRFSIAVHEDGSVAEASPVSCFSIHVLHVQVHVACNCKCFHYVRAWIIADLSMVFLADGLAD